MVINNRNTKAISSNNGNFFPISQTFNVLWPKNHFGTKLRKKIVLYDFIKKIQISRITLFLRQFHFAFGKLNFIPKDYYSGFSEREVTKSIADVEYDFYYLLTWSFSSVFPSFLSSIFLVIVIFFFLGVTLRGKRKNFIKNEKLAALFSSPEMGSQFPSRITCSILFLSSGVKFTWINFLYKLSASPKFSSGTLC